MSGADAGPDAQGFGRTSVWDFPRTPRIASEPRRVRVYVGGIPVVSTDRCLQVLEEGHAPRIYVPGQDLKHCELRRLTHSTEVEHIGLATEYTLIAAGSIAHRALWTFPNPLGQFRRLIGYFGIDPGRVERAMVGGLAATRQQGVVQPGWVTDELVGPFVGEPGEVEDAAEAPVVEQADPPR